MTDNLYMGAELLPWLNWSILWPFVLAVAVGCISPLTFLAAYLKAKARRKREMEEE